MEVKLSEERTWNATQLAEALEKREFFGIEVSPEAVRQHLRSIGYSWKRTRYVPNNPPDPEQERKARKSWRLSKKARKGDCVLKYLGMRAACVCV